MFAYRTPDVKKLKTVDDPIGPDNDEHLKEIIKEADMLVPFWGTRNKLGSEKLNHYLDEMLKLLLESGKPVMSLGLTGSKDPRHTQGVGKDTPLTPWNELIKK